MSTDLVYLILLSPTFPPFLLTLLLPSTLHEDRIYLLYKKF